MSSATSIKRSFRLKADATGADGTGAEVTAADATAADATEQEVGFRPWHFFVLVSLVASTAAVLMSRRSSPEHLILISFTIGAAGVAAAAFYRMLAPLALRDVSLLSEPPSERALAALEREKALVLRSIKELEFDRAMGKVSATDFDEMRGRLRARALMLMKQIDAGGSGYRELIERELQARLKMSDARSAVPLNAATADRSRTVKAEDRALRTCASCRTSNDHDAAFCKRCGKSLTVVIQ